MMNDEVGDKLLASLGVPESEREGQNLGFAKLPQRTQQTLRRHFDANVKFGP